MASCAKMLQKMDNLGPRAKLVYSYSLLIMMVLFNTSSLACTQMLQGSIPDWTLGTIRLFIQTILLFIFVRYSDQFRYLKIDEIPSMIAAVSSYVIFNYGYYSAAKCLPLADHGCLSQLFMFTSMAVLLWVYTFEPPGKVNIIAICLSLSGTVLTTQPTIFFSHSTLQKNYSCITNFSLFNDSHCQYHNTVLDQTPFCYFLIIVGSIAYSSYVFVLAHPLKHVTVPLQLFWMSCGSTFVSLLCTLYIEAVDLTFIFDMQKNLLLLGHSFAATFCVLCSVSVSRLLGGIILTIAESLTILSELLCQYSFLKSYQPGNQNALEVIGVFIIITGVSLPAVLHYVKIRYGVSPGK